MKSISTIVLQRKTVCFHIKIFYYNFVKKSILAKNISIEVNNFNYISVTIKRVLTDNSERGTKRKVFNVMVLPKAKYGFP